MGGDGKTVMKASARKVRRLIADDFARAYAQCDVIAGPMLAHKAEEEGVAAVEQPAVVGVDRNAGVAGRVPGQRDHQNVRLAFAEEIQVHAHAFPLPRGEMFPQVVGFELTGKLPEGATATDLVLTITEKLRKLHQQVDSGVVPDDRLTVRAFLDRWLTVNLPGSVAESTEDDYVDTVRLHLVPALGRKPLAKLTAGGPWRFADAAALIDGLVLNETFLEFLTIPAYEQLG